MLDPFLDTLPLPLPLSIVSSLAPTSSNFPLDKKTGSPLWGPLGRRGNLENRLGRNEWRCWLYEVVEANKPMPETTAADSAVCGSAAHPGRHAYVGGKGFARCLGAGWSGGACELEMDLDLTTPRTGSAGMAKLRRRPLSTAAAAGQHGHERMGKLEVGGGLCCCCLALTQLVDEGAGDAQTMNRAALSMHSLIQP